MLMGHDLVYFKLHGLPSQPFWYGDDWITALHTSAFHNVALKGTVVFVANCHLVESPFLDVILHTGATVIGGSGANFAQAEHVTGADQLGLYFRRALGTRVSPARALTIAKYMLDLRTQRMEKAATRADATRAADLHERARANQDALQFRIYRS
jgi:hypothetical protein